MDLTDNLDAETIALLKALATAYLANNEIYKAAEKFKQLLDYGIDDNDIQLNYALSLARTDRIDKEAFAAYNQVIQNKQANNTLYLTLATLFLRENITSQPALKVYLKALTLSPPLKNEIHAALYNIFSEIDDAVSRTDVSQALLEYTNDNSLLGLFLNAAWEEKKYESTLYVLKVLYKNTDQKSQYLKSICETLLEKKANADAKKEDATFDRSDFNLCMRLRNLNEPLRYIRDLELYLDLKDLFTTQRDSDSLPNAKSGNEYSFIVSDNAIENISEISDDIAGKVNSDFFILRDLVNKINVTEKEQTAPNRHKVAELFLSQLNTIAFLEIKNFDENSDNLVQATSTFLGFIRNEFNFDDIILCGLQDGLLAISDNSVKLLQTAIEILSKLERYNQVVDATEILDLRVTVYRTDVPFIDLKNYGLRELRKAIKIHNVALDDLIAEHKPRTEEPVLLVNESIANNLKSSRFERLGTFKLNHIQEPIKIFKVECFDEISIARRSGNTPSTRKHIGKYDISETLKENALWATYRGYDEQLHRKVIIKAYKAQAFAGFKEFEPLKKQFYQEIRKLSKISHPAVNLTYDVGEDGEILYLVREFIEGQSLAEKQSTENLDDVNSILTLYVKICQTLKVFHQNQLWHKNLKPNNVWLTGRKRLKLVDAGLLQINHAKTAWADTNPYVAPEQIQGLKITHGCDNFLLGLMLYESLTGVHPFKWDKGNDVRIRFLADDPLPASSLRPEIPIQLDEILAKSLSKNPQERYGSLMEFELDLRRAHNFKESSLPATPV